MGTGVSSDRLSPMGGEILAAVLQQLLRGTLAKPERLLQSPFSHCLQQGRQAVLKELIRVRTVEQPSLKHPAPEYVRCKKGGIHIAT